MAMILPTWNGYIRGTMFRLGISMDEMAWTIGYSVTYFGKQLASEKTTKASRVKIENGLLKCAEKRGFSAQDLSRFSEGFYTYTPGEWAC